MVSRYIIMYFFIIYSQTACSMKVPLSTITISCQEVSEDIRKHLPEFSTIEMTTSLNTKLITLFLKTHPHGKNFHCLLTNDFQILSCTHESSTQRHIIHADAIDTKKQAIIQALIAVAKNYSNAHH